MIGNNTVTNCYDWMLTIIIINRSGMISKIARIVPQLTRYSHASIIGYNKVYNFRSNIFYFADEKKSPIKPHKPLASDEPMMDGEMKPVD